MQQLQLLSEGCQSEFDRLCSWWKAHAVDKKKGGFYGQIAQNGEAVEDAHRGGVYIARILWFFSTAAVHSGQESDAAMALRARDYLLGHFVDTQYGGIYWQVDAEGQAVNKRKQGYAQAFAIYGLAAHFSINGDKRSLKHALALFDLLETHFCDNEQGGYWEAFGRDWNVIEDVRLSEQDVNAPKTMNTHLHILEAYTQLYRIAPLPRVGAALAKLIELHNTKIYRADIGHLRLFWQADWQDISEDVSFGHDIEASWLLCEAANVLGDEDIIAVTQGTALHLAHTCLVEAMGPAGEIFNERNLGTGHVDRTRIWWAQAEALVGFLNAYQLTGDADYLVQVDGMWRFITKTIISEGHEWNWFSRLDTDKVSPYQTGHWKACYHNGRAMLECIERIRKL